jgi:hypothetical protein
MNARNELYIHDIDPSYSRINRSVKHENEPTTEGQSTIVTAASAAVAAAAGTHHGEGGGSNFIQKFINKFFSS